MINLDEINKKRSIDILCFTEHNMISGDEAELNILGYRLASCCSRKTRHGGSCILIRNGLEDIYIV